MLSQEWTQSLHCPLFTSIIGDCDCDCVNLLSQCDVFSLQLMLERKSKEVGKLIEETEKSMKDLAENINQAKVNAQ